jgi:hypothetical protein
MNELRTRIEVGEDHRISGIAPADVPPGIHEATITVKSTARKALNLDSFPTHDLPWDNATPTRREEMYGDDGR